MPITKYLSSPFRYQSPILSYKFRYQAPIVMNKHRIKLNRLFVTSPVAYADDETDAGGNESKGGARKKADHQGGTGISVENFHTLDKNVAILDWKIDRVQGDVKNLGRKADKLLFSIIGAVILMGGFDLYRDERNWTRAHKDE